jgi:hypothetical protein
VDDTINGVTRCALICNIEWTRFTSYRPRKVLIIPFCALLASIDPIAIVSGRTQGVAVRLRRRRGAACGQGGHTGSTFRRTAFRVIAHWTWFLRLSITIVSGVTQRTLFHPVRGPGGPPSIRTINTGCQPTIGTKRPCFTGLFPPLGSAGKSLGAWVRACSEGLFPIVRMVQPIRAIFTCDGMRTGLILSRPTLGFDSPVAIMPSGACLDGTVHIHPITIELRCVDTGRGGERVGGRSVPTGNTGVLFGLVLILSHWTLYFNAVQTMVPDMTRRTFFL